MTSFSQRETRLAANRDIKKVVPMYYKKRCVYNYPTMSPKREHQEETAEQRKTRLAAQRERAGLVMSNLRHQFDPKLT